MPKKDNDYDVGYRRPPKEHQFKPDQSGKPKGRPRSSKNIDTIFDEIGRGRVRVTIDGKTRTVTRREAVGLKLFLRAMEGDVRALDSFLSRSEAVDAKAERRDAETKLDSVDIETLLAAVTDQQTSQASEAFNTQSNAEDPPCS